VKKFLHLLGKGVGGFLLLIIGAIFMVILLVVRLVFHILERILYYPHLVIKAVADGCAGLLKSFVTGYESAARLKKKAMKGEVVGGVFTEGGKPS
jgi:uncharacterized membrane protein